MRVLCVLEVSQKQAFIFASNKLRENVKNSELIDWVMSPEYFEKVAGDADVFTKKENLVYSGGGHIVLEFSSREKAVKFNKIVTERISRDYPGIAVFVATKDYDESENAGRNIKLLMEALELKKSRRIAAFHQGSFGIEKIDTNTLKPKYVGREVEDKDLDIRVNKVNAELSVGGYKTAYELSDLGGSKNDSNFVAVVHIDGNAMGNRVENLYSQYGAADWCTYKAKLQEFSECIDSDFKNAYKLMIQTVVKNIEKGNLTELESKGYLPVRRIITAGDDICFVSEGRIGVECAVAFIKALNNLKNKVDGKGYSACAGVAIVHQKYPFFRAYELAEMLCGNAKRFGANLSDKDAGANVSSIDWHIEYGEIKETLDEVRKQYKINDATQMELRPYIISANAETLASEKIRVYDSFKNAICKLLKRDMDYARGDLKMLRSAIKQGEVATKGYLKLHRIEELLDDINSAFTKELENIDSIGTGVKVNNEAFVQTRDGVKRSMLFDVIELIDTYLSLEY